MPHLYDNVGEPDPWLSQKQYTLYSNDISVPSRENIFCLKISKDINKKLSEETHNQWSVFYWRGYNLCMSKVNFVPVYLSEVLWDNQVWLSFHLGPDCTTEERHNIRIFLLFVFNQKEWFIMCFGNHRIALIMVVLTKRGK